MGPPVNPHVWAPIGGVAYALLAACVLLYMLFCLGERK